MSELKGADPIETLRLEAGIVILAACAADDDDDSSSA